MIYIKPFTHSVRCNLFMIDILNAAAIRRSPRYVNIVCIKATSDVGFCDTLVLKENTNKTSKCSEVHSQ